MTEEELLALAAQPKKVRTTSAEIENHSIAEQIALDRYLASRAAQTASGGSPFAGLRITKANPPGAV